MALIDSDIVNPEMDVPADVNSFSALHDYVDANEYLLQGVPDPGDWEAWQERMNAVSDIVDMRLRARRPLDNVSIPVITDAVTRDLHTGTTWDDIKDRTVTELCAAKQAALLAAVRDMPEHAIERLSMCHAIRVLDWFLGTNRRSEIPD
jgi:hypothetical protein